MLYVAHGSCRSGHRDRNTVASGNGLNLGIINSKIGYNLIYIWLKRCAGTGVCFSAG